MNRLTEIKNLLETAESSLRSAKKMLLEMSGESSSASFSAPSYSPSSSSEGGRVIEGIFNGERMMGSDGQPYPVPANYASKSKLVEGDHLKLTIMSDGRFVYKQIGPVPRKTVIGTLIHDDSQYRVLAGGKSFRVLLASVTYYKARVGDKVTIIVPTSDDAQWATIEAVLPKDVTSINVIDDEPMQEELVDF